MGADTTNLWHTLPNQVSEAVRNIQFKALRRKPSAFIDDPLAPPLAESDEYNQNCSRGEHESQIVTLHRFDSALFRASSRRYALIVGSSSSTAAWIDASTIHNRSTAIRDN
jgi:hypothetical protein